MAGEEVEHNAAGLVLELDEVTVAAALDDVEFGTRDALGEERCVGRGVHLVVAAVDDESGRGDGGEQLPGVVAFAGHVVEFLGEFRDGIGEAGADRLDVFRV